MRTAWLWLVLVPGCLFDGAQTMGLPCNNDAECGRGIGCIERVCGGPAIATDTDPDPDTDTEVDESEDESESSAADDDSVRDMCVPEDTQCVNDDALRYCSDDGKLTTIGCPGICGEFRQTLGCHHVPSENTDNCICTFDIQTCTTPGAWSCSGGGGQAQCIDGVQQQEDCDTTCVEGGYRGADYCDGGTCYCSDITCTEAAQRCTDADTIAGCWGGTWYPESCTTICRENGYEKSLGCFFYPGDDSGCMCL